jgi:magnesium transporter
MKDNIIQPVIGMLVAERNAANLNELLSSWPPAEIAELIGEFDEQEERCFIFESLSPDHAAETFEYLDVHFQIEILEEIPQNRVPDILNKMSPDDRTALLEDLPPHTVSQLIAVLSPQERAVALSLLGYPENSVGRLMTTDYTAVRAEWTIQHTLDYIRMHGSDSETLNVIYVVDDKGYLIDDIRVREFLLADPAKKVADLMDHKYQSLKVDEDQETVIEKFRNLNRVALPVTDKDEFLLGIVTVDDVLDVVEEEATEDIQKLGAVEVFDEPYMSISLGKLVKKRAGWLVILFLSEMLTTLPMTYFEGEIEKALVLALFIPLIISSGGNTGSQASTLIIRAMALGEIKLRDWWKVMRREILAGIALGSILGTIGLCRISIWHAFFTDKNGIPMYGPHWLLVGFTVMFALVGVVLWGTIAGSMLPLILKKVRLDPATSSAPFVATLVDVTGLVIYFSVAWIIMHGTLL